MENRVKKRTKHVPYNPALTARARENRKALTPAEQKLWYEVLQDRTLLGLKFTRQKPLDEYVVDFYCAKLRLAIEVDGDTHVHAQYDHNRTRRLNELGVEVIRYTNDDVLENVDGLYEDLRAYLKRRKEQIRDK